jgi:PAS domain S-box-containing protein
MITARDSNERETAGKTAVRSDEMYSKLSLEPAYFLIILMLSIFLGEILIMIILPRIIPPHLYRGSIIDALLLVVIVFPILFLFAFRPMRSHINQLKRMKEELQRGEERYRSLVESTDDSIYLVDKDYKYIFINKKHQARMSLTENQIKGRSYGEFHSTEGTKAFENAINDVFTTGNSVQREHKSHRDNRYFLRTFSPVKDPFGQVEAVTVVSKDVSNLKAGA